MVYVRRSVGMGVAFALTTASMAQAQTPAAAPAVVPAAAPMTGPAQPGDADLTCAALALEMGKAAQSMALAQSQAQATAAPAPATADARTAQNGALVALTSAAGGTANLEQIGRAYQQQQNAQQLANLQMMAARGGVNPGTAGAAIGGLAAMQQLAANGGNVQDAAGSMVANRMSGELAKRIPGGAMLGGLMGGFMKKKKKPVEVAAVAPAAAAGGAQARLTFLSALVTAKGCK